MTEYTSMRCVYMAVHPVHAKKEEQLDDRIVDCLNKDLMVGRNRAICDCKGRF